MKENTKKLVEMLGGKENIKSINHCMTRLRAQLNDSTLLNKEGLENNHFCKGIVVNGENIQIVIGVKVKEIFKEILTFIGEKDEAKKNRLSFFSEIFLPMISWILMTGMLLIFLKIPFLKEFRGIKELYEVLLRYFPAVLGYSLFTYFGKAPIVGIAFGFLMINLDLGDNLLVVLPAFYFLKKLNDILEKHIKDPFKILLAPSLSILIGYIIVSFFLKNLGEIVLLVFINWMETVFDWKYYPILAGIFGGVYALSVKYGLHHILLFLDLQLILSGVGTFFWPMVVVSNIAQGAVALGSSFREWKAAGLAYIGITEPAMYGINLKENRRFVLAIILSSLGGYLCGIYRVKSMGIGPGGIPAILVVNENSRIKFILIIVFIIVSGVILGLFLKKIRFKEN
ncbi:PTS transporter subunit EIIB (plasmid) [Cetobacterium somerae]|uniref:PTS transporter subunit EIIB n=1 Tax=Cetobacterium somerae TaxID=188913 RepID=UPI001F068B9A|nr:PTS transporter subunit EIIB [Cetobacterium somerae]UPO98594.1 PTS transporter subunit EIIB [Cetobacterium somerae]